MSKTLFLLTLSLSTWAIEPIVDASWIASNLKNPCKKRTHPATRDVLIRPPMTFSFGHQKRC